MLELKKDHLLKKIKGGQNVYGTCISSIAPHWPVAAKKAGLDFVFIDTEHIALDRSQLATLCQLYEALGISPIVRIPNPDSYLACQAIDAGARGVVAPYVESVEQITQLTAAVKYRPLKGEVLTSYLCGEKLMTKHMQDYLQAYNYGNICIANIESVPAIQRLDELLSVAGLDAVFIGPHDLSVSMGIPEEYDNPLFEEALTTIIKKCRERKIAVGVHFSLEVERQLRWVKVGANLVIHSFDVALFSQRLCNDIFFIKNEMGDTFNESSGKDLIV
ncbi:aldolase/citrate lyase family protein [Sphingobacterium sp. UT-1RO-CII-1]|uniref:HpcH/HpaI aldolase family protein n=1 Tax=Sphingobacterium sp. UT-1RO-CII-1 TaxID=2995225 RepID=UPI00227BF955|nr:aldolase/citrate lyase family protein [Sphingobacterium sp. UT-1RO-CII-1]MCY4779420.1 aldolase/citrate lyase family protein [Sphingobacterium sp. UT-1RO-CII-1]